MPPEPDKISALQELAAAALIALSPAIIAILGWVAKKVADLVNANVNQKSVAGALVRLDYAAVNAVKYVEQCVVKATREARDPNSPGGESITKEEGERIKAVAIDAARSFLGPRGIHELMAVLGIGESELNGVIADRIEASVHDMRTTEQAIKATADLPRVSIPPA